MRSTTSLIALAGIGALVFLAGRASVADASRVAMAQPDTARPASGDAGQPAVSDADAAWMEAGTPGPHHQMLETMTGTWEAAVKIRMAPGAEPMESTGTATREMIFGGRFLREDVVAQTPFGPMHGLGYVGYNNLTGQYEMVWMDDMSTPMMRETGWYDASKRLLHTRGSSIDAPTGRVVPMRTIVDMSSSRRHTITSYAIAEDGSEYVAFEGVFERTGD